MWIASQMRISHSTEGEIRRLELLKEGQWLYARNFIRWLLIVVHNFDWRLSAIS
jgi:hypothetical protein